MPFLTHRNDGINENHEIRATADSIDRILRGRVAIVEMGAERRGHMPSRREADYADALGIQFKFGSSGTDRAHRALNIEHRNRMLIGLDAVLQDDPGNALLV